MDLIKSIDGIEYRKFIPTIFRLYYPYYDREEAPEYWNSRKHFIGMLYKLIINRYYIVYMMKNNEMIGHFVISKGGHFIDSTSKDIIIGPIWINPYYRGQGYGELGIKDILHNLEIEYEAAYEYISKVNYASIRVVEKNNFTLFGSARRTGRFIKKFELSEKGGWNIYKFKKVEGN